MHFHFIALAVCVCVCGIKILSRELRALCECVCDCECGWECVRVCGDASCKFSGQETYTSRPGANDFHICDCTALRQNAQSKCFVSCSPLSIPVPQKRSFLTWRIHTLNISANRALFCLRLRSRKFALDDNKMQETLNKWTASSSARLCFGILLQF